MSMGQSVPDRPTPCPFGEVVPATAAALRHPTPYETEHAGTFSSAATCHGSHDSVCACTLQKCLYMPRNVTICVRLRGEWRSVCQSIRPKNLRAPQPPCQ